MTSSEITAIVISSFSLVLAAIALGWNIYRDVVYRAKLKVSLMWGVVTIGHDREQWPYRLFVSITNFGPNDSRASMLHLRKTSLWLRIRRKTVYAMLNPDYEDPLSGKIPADIKVGEKIDLSFRPVEDIFIRKDEFTQIGITDPFGRVHWCSRKHYKMVRQKFLEDSEHNGEQGSAHQSTTAP